MDTILGNHRIDFIYLNCLIHIYLCQSIIPNIFVPKFVLWNLLIHLYSLLFASSSCYICVFILYAFCWVLFFNGVISIKYYILCFIFIIALLFFLWCYVVLSNIRFFDFPKEETINNWVDDYYDKIIKITDECSN